MSFLHVDQLRVFGIGVVLDNRSRDLLEHVEFFGEGGLSCCVSVLMFASGCFGPATSSRCSLVRPVLGCLALDVVAFRTSEAAGVEHDEEFDPRVSCHFVVVSSFCMSLGPVESVEEVVDVFVH